MLRFGKWKDTEGRTRTALTVLACVVTLLALFAAIGVLAGEYSGIRGLGFRFPNGTTVNGVSIGGLDERGAREQLAGAVEAMLKEYSCTVMLPGGCGEAVFRADELGVETDIETVLINARAGGAFQLSYMPSAYRARLAFAELAKRVDEEPVPYETECDKSLVPAGERFRVSGGREGRRLDVEACAIMASSGLLSFTAPFTEIPAPGSGAETPHLLGAYETSFSSGSLSRSERVFNIVKAAELINGSVVEPYSVFSCNEALGDRTEENGWQLAPGITNGGAGTLDQPGGGVCQVTSTLFNAVLYADMPIIYRQAHSRPVAYCEPGRDAAVDTDSIDFIWKNNTPFRVWVFAWAEEGVCRCEIWGFSEKKYDIEVETVCTGTVPASADEYELDPALSPWECVEQNPAIEGGSYLTYRVYCSGGEECGRELAAESEYNMHPRRFRCGSRYYEAATGSAPAQAGLSGKTPKPVSTPAPTKKPTPRPTAKPTRTPKPTERPEITHSPSQAPTETPAPEETPSPTKTPAPTETPAAGNQPTEEPSEPPTEAPQITATSSF